MKHFWLKISFWLKLWRISNELVAKANNQELAYVLIRLLLLLTQAALKTDDPQFAPLLLYFLNSFHVDFLIDRKYLDRYGQGKAIWHTKIERIA